MARAGVARASGPAAEGLLATVRSALADDLDTPSALSLVERWCVPSCPDAAAPWLVADAVDALLGISLR